MNLYQHTQLATLQNYVDAETGEVDIEGFNNAQIALQDKQLAVVAYLKNESLRIDMLDNAIKDLQARKKAMQNAHEGLKNYLLVNMQANGISEIAAQDMTFVAKIKKNPPSVIIDNVDLLDAKFMVTPPAPPPQPDKTAIKLAIQSGEIVEGAHIEQHERVEIK